MTPAPAASAEPGIVAPVLVSLSSFGAAEVRRHGQLWFADLARQAGADGVEVRGELLADAERELPAIAQAMSQAGLACVYSSPDGLWTTGGEFDPGALDRALACATLLRAQRLKMSIGQFNHRSRPSLRRLRDVVANSPVELLVENDQTAAAGTIDALAGFLADAAGEGLELGMTFDMGNWHWTGECPRAAARMFARHVRYVHCKGVQRQPRKWVAVPLADSAAPWRTILRELPRGVACAIEFPLAGDDLVAVTRSEIEQLRAAARSLS